MSQPETISADLRELLAQHEKQSVEKELHENLLAHVVDALEQHCSENEVINFVQSHMLIDADSIKAYIKYVNDNYRWRLMR